MERAGHHTWPLTAAQFHRTLGSSRHGWGRSSQLQAAPPGSLLQPDSQKHLTPTRGMDHNRSVISHMALTLCWSPADVPACPLILKLTLSTRDVGRSRCVETLSRGFVKTKPPGSRPDSARSQAPGAGIAWFIFCFSGWRGPPPFQVPHSQFAKQERIKKISVKQKRSRLLSDVFCCDFVSL